MKVLAFSVFIMESAVVAMLTPAIESDRPIQGVKALVLVLIIFAPLASLCLLWPKKNKPRKAIHASR